MTTTIGSLDLNAFSDLYSDSNQYFWFEGNASATYGAGAHVTLVPDTTFISNPTGQNILMNTEGFSIRNGLLPMMTLDNDSLDFNVVDTTAGTYTITATFTATGAQIGQSGESHLEMDNNGMCLVDRDDTKYFEVSDLRDGDGFLVDRFVGDGQKYAFILSSMAIEPSSADNTAVTVDGIPQTFGIDTSDHWYVVSTFGYYSVVQFPYDSPPADGAVIVVKYMSSGNTTAFTFGTRKQEAPVGGLSSVFGDNCEARTPYTFAQGKGTVAIFKNQAVFGRYNDPDEEGDYSFIIGNGTADNARSNALMVDWNGDIYPQATKMADFIVDQGTDNNWVYRKWNGGRYEAWLRYNATGMALTSASSNTYYSATSGVKNVTLPSFNVGTDYYVTGQEQPSMSSSVYIYSIQTYSATQMQVSYRAHASTASAQCNGMFYLMGKWK